MRLQCQLSWGFLHPQTALGVCLICLLRAVCSASLEKPDMQSHQRKLFCLWKNRPTPVASCMGRSREHQVLLWAVLALSEPCTPGTGKGSLRLPPGASWDTSQVEGTSDLCLQMGTSFGDLAWTHLAKQQASAGGTKGHPESPASRSHTLAPPRASTFLSGDRVSVKTCRHQGTRRAV